MFEPGDIVECVDARPTPGCLPWGNDRPTEGQIYTVRDMPVDWLEDRVVRLRELDRDPCVKADYGPNAGYLPRRFRLLKRRDPDLIAKLLKEPEPDLVSDMVEF